jgi:hypothetical protein
VYLPELSMVPPVALHCTVTADDSSSEPGVVVAVKMEVASGASIWEEGLTTTPFECPLPLLLRLASAAVIGLDAASNCRLWVTPIVVASGRTTSSFAPAGSLDSGPLGPLSLHDMLAVATATRALALRRARRRDNLYVYVTGELLRSHLPVLPNPPGPPSTLGL